MPGLHKNRFLVQSCSSNSCCNHATRHGTRKRCNALSTALRSRDLPVLHALNGTRLFFVRIDSYEFFQVGHDSDVRKNQNVRAKRMQQVKLCLALRKMSRC